MIDCRRYHGQSERCSHRPVDVSDSTVEKYLEYLQVERNASPHTMRRVSHSAVQIQALYGPQRTVANQPS